MDATHPPRLGDQGLEIQMSQVTIKFDGRSQVVDRAVAERQVASAEAAIAKLRNAMQERHARKDLSDSEQRAADARTETDIARYAAIAAACRAALAA